MPGSVYNFLYLFVRFLTSAFNICLLVRIFLPYFTGFQSNRLYQFVYDITEPVLGPIRRVIPPVMGLDFSPMIAMLLVSMVSMMLTNILGRLA